MENIFDTHAHYDDERFRDDLEETLTAVHQSGVSLIINCGCDIASCKSTLELCDKFSFVYGAVGIHPHEAEDALENAIELIKELAKHKKAVAIGEIGLDYHYDFSPREIQKDIFERQLILANELNLPVIVHDRESHQDTLDLLTKYRPKGVVHCFSGSAEMAQEIVKLGMYIGLGGAVTFKNARKPLEVAQSIPLDKLLLETDAPYMSPVPFRGKRNDSSLIPYTAEKIAEVRGEEPQFIIDTATENGKRLFGI
ncbi:MAG: TatD family hydrolase [Clostridia bacterium]|nr:TatD family hydrolase [Clostridia bacterium]